MSWTHPDMEAIAALVSKRTGLSFANRQANAELSIRRSMARARVADLSQYTARLATDGHVLDELINDLTVGETYFFREPGHFQVIQREILPEIERRRGVQHLVRAWSASCASGEEAYSLAILFDQVGISPQAHLVATDISTSALAKARQADFSAWSLRGESTYKAIAYLTQVRMNYRLDQKIRQRVAFFHLNLALDAYPSFANGLWGMDLILCRNVLIYLDRHTVGQVARRLYHTLAEGGWLITASSDPPLWDEAPFEVVSRDEGLFYRRPANNAGVSVQPAAINEPQPNVTDREGEAPAEPEAPQLLSSNPVSRGLTARQEPRPPVSGGLTEPPSSDYMEDATKAALHVRALANLDPVAAELECGMAASRHPLCVELQYLHAILLLDSRRYEAAAHAMRRALYLDRTLAVAHYTLGTILLQHGDLAGARRAFRNARELCAARPPEEAVPLADGETAGRLAEVAAAEFALLEAS